MMFRVVSITASALFNSFHSSFLVHASIIFWHALRASGFLYSNQEEPLNCPYLFQTRLNVSRVKTWLHRSEKSASACFSQKVTQRFGWASSLKVKMLKMFRAEFVTAILSTHIKSKRTTTIQLQCVNAWCDEESGAQGLSMFPFHRHQRIAVIEASSRTSLTWTLVNTLN